MNPFKKAHTEPEPNYPIFNILHKKIGGRGIYRWCEPCKPLVNLPLTTVTLPSSFNPQ